MTIRLALHRAGRILTSQGVPDAQLDAELLLSAMLGKQRLYMLAERDLPLDRDQASRYFALVARRARREPLQYILGFQYFMGHRFQVSPDVLIPRQDTETLCVEALARLKGGEEVLDLCTGSGAVAISLVLHCPDLFVTAADLSGRALAIARRNALRLRARVRFEEGDLFSPVSGETFDMIVCNPPYVPEGDLSALQAELHAEPTMALAGGADGLAFYRRLFAQAPAYLRDGAWLLCEMGDSQSEAVLSLAGRNFSGLRVHEDLSGRARVLSARLWR